MTEVLKKLFLANEASDSIGGLFVSTEEYNPEILSISIDSRTVSKGSLFVALKGEITDGHKYLADAFRAGAAAALISREHYSGIFMETGELECYVVVEDTLKGFQKLAARWVDNFDQLIKIAVTGSNGKSTTKEMIGSILSEEGSTIINEGNLNSETGLPLSVFKIDNDHKFGVFEMGINHPGEMKDLVSVFKPHYALITNIGNAHIGLMGNQEAIAKEKSDIFSLFKKNDIAFIFEEDTWAFYLKSRCSGSTIMYGTESTEGIGELKNLGLNGWEINYKDQKIHLKLIGDHNLLNAIAAISLTSSLGVDSVRIKAGLEKMEALKGRSQVIEGRFTIIEDSYNANAESMDRIFNFISELNWPGRIILILGSMKELGDSTAEMHRQVGAQAVSLNPAAVFFFGQEMKSAYNSAFVQGTSSRLEYYENFSDLEKNVPGYLQDGDLVLLKGSRSMNLNKLADILSDSREVMDV
jgi:UDP-N-acetylmuramoyl-tripeptide--D-alanyl-D-alanine ligase